MTPFIRQNFISHLADEVFNVPIENSNDQCIDVWPTQGDAEIDLLALSALFDADKAQVIQPLAYLHQDDNNPLVAVFGFYSGYFVMARLFLNPRLHKQSLVPSA